MLGVPAREGVRLAVRRSTYKYHAEFEWDDMDAFKAAVGSEAFAAAGKDAMAMGIPFTVNFASIE